ncbi:putative lysophospholipase [Cyphellophora attinorum]|uniref:Lysophospholipase n=1 Tax=Cyphellophora attinorum TaxID=1664694 RepID=A0A0N1HCH0_9EURO|nr:putative lysophospholipase [Phialophora attinorum]KPI42392.1 putative lysophospholipase [Phialophora attinorum]
MTYSFTSVALLCCAALTVAVPARRASSAYAPVGAPCPAQQLVRQADGVSSAESDWVANRYGKTSEALATWLQNIDSGFEISSGHWRDWHGKRQWSDHGSHGQAPIIGLTSSGGGYRAQLSGAGVVKAFDGREANTTKVSGLYQALTYHAGLSGGSWLLSSIVGNNYPTISFLQTTLWETALQESLLVPAILVSEAARPIYGQVVDQIQAKVADGYQSSIVDPWGRLLSYGLLLGTAGGVQDTMSGISALPNFTSFNGPYPIITALGSDLNIDGTCIPQVNATQYEFHPYEFGSWDQGVDAFVVTEYLGTRFSGGVPVGNCITHYDQLGYVLGTSSNVFAAVCSAIPANMTAAATAVSLAENLAYLANPGAQGISEDQIFGLWPNPFQGYGPSSHVAAQKTLDLVDGGVGVGFQGNPIWPFLHRDQVDVLIVNENSADTVGNYPNGSEIYNTYLAAKAAGLSRMPEIPTADVFVAHGLNKKPTFFGCNSADTLTIIDIPNVNYTFNSGEPTAKIQYFKNETEAMISNGVLIGNYGGKEDWPLCLACGIMKKSGGSLPSGCEACFAEYCYN